jgi:hypothetical protein
VMLVLLLYCQCIQSLREGLGMVVSAVHGLSRMKSSSRTDTALFGLVMALIEAPATSPSDTLAGPGSF